MSIISMDELNVCYTLIVAKYISKGYTINTTTMSGCYANEICHVDLVKHEKDDGIFRVWMVREYGDTFKGEHDTVQIRVKKYYDSDSMWLSNGLEIKCITAYAVSHYKHRYTFSLKEANSIKQLQHKRWKSQQGCQDLDGFNRKDINLDKLPQSTKDSIMRRINSCPGFKRAKFDCVTSIILGHANYAGRMEAIVNYNYNGKSGYMIFK